jgi:hypothetical protein
MDNANLFIFSILKHVDIPYDPVKAHEYYIRNRELKGRQNTSDLKTQTKKEAWGYAKSQLDETKKQDLQLASDSNKTAVQQIREAAQGRRTEISDKLSLILDRFSNDRTARLDKITTDSQKELQKIEDETQKKIDALPPIPKGVSDKRRAELSKERSDELDKIRNESKSQKDGVRSKASEDKAGVSIETTIQKQSQRDSTNSDREQLRVTLKDTIDSARENYKALKDNLKATYEADKQSNFEAIKQTVR